MNSTDPETTDVLIRTPAADMDEETPLLKRRLTSSESKVGNIFTYF